MSNVWKLPSWKTAPSGAKPVPVELKLDSNSTRIRVVGTTLSRIVPRLPLLAPRNRSIGSLFTFTKFSNRLTLLGDVNVDGKVDYLDIAPFIGLLAAGTFQAEADVNESGEVNFLDISPFIGILSSP